MFKDGKSVAFFPVRVVYLERPKDACTLKAGFTVNKKNFKRAVDRNRLKRLMREAYRLQKNALKSALENKENSALLFFIFIGKELVPFKTIFSQAGKALLEIEKRISGNV